ncbi:LytR/AlgR family response regulator transcription factor [Luteibaculum oceani]|uniref:Response regulator transcription factor n=1 Tax=Luteibaculum oceani TaxID=1294296 RepID=A0A5C6VNP8_9FLAO|nr:LytTR family DNA-binding domain-containing protein [Luteibaculum oceani]TXC85255.1 response regulator transcription factor [Luteibaculum oceani]
MKIAIAEDDFIVAEQLRKIVENFGCKVVFVEHNTKKFLDRLVGEKIDLALLDIRMDTEDSGFRIATELQQKHIPFMFVSAHSDVNTLSQASRLKPVGYLTKPFNRAQIKASLITVSGLLENSSITVKSGSETHKLSVSDILFIKSDNVYCEIHTKSKGRILVRTSLKSLEPEFEDTSVVRCHRSYMVNLHHVQSYNKTEAKINEQIIPITKAISLG